MPSGYGDTDPYEGGQPVLRHERLTGSSGSSGGILGPEDFSILIPQGFGDRQNSWIWCMRWWKEHLYVGTSRAPACINQRMANIGLPLVPYPQDDPDIECAPDPNDLPLRAEIWRWDPKEDLWERVYQSPEDIPIPGTGKLVARDVGYRELHVFEEPDGTEAMYVSGVSSRSIHHEEPRPPGARILRTTDGVHFDPIPQDPNTYLGDLENASFRGMTTYKGRLYVIAGTYTGPGVVLESENPAGGNDTFRQVILQGQRVMEVGAFSGHLYFGLRETAGNGYSVVRTDAEGEQPYELTTVVPAGAWIERSPNTDILSMVEFKGALYCGGNGIGNDIGAPPLPTPQDLADLAPETLTAAGPAHVEEDRYIKAAEIIRIHPDDRWELVVGRPRTTPAGFMAPLSGFSSGFSYPFNAHMWRMAVHNDVLYVGTFDSSTTFKEVRSLKDLLGPFMGFNIYASKDGIHFESVTRNGFGDPLQFGCRTMASTPYGLMVGTATFYYGALIHRGVP